MSNVTDPIADFLTRLRNSRSARLETLQVPYSKMKVEMTRILKAEGYIAAYEVETGGQVPQIRITNKFVNRTPAITGIKRVSRPGLRRYVGAQDVPRVLNGMGIAILSTSSGILTDRDARKQNVGGELLAYVW